jgi:hypothetical protein
VDRARQLIGRDVILAHLDGKVFHVTTVDTVSPMGIFVICLGRAYPIRDFFRRFREVL